MKIILNSVEVSDMVLDRCKVHKYVGPSDDTRRKTVYVFQRDSRMEVFSESDLVEISVEFEGV